MHEITSISWPLKIGVEHDNSKLTSEHDSHKIRHEQSFGISSRRNLKSSPHSDRGCLWRDHISSLSSDLDDHSSSGRPKVYRFGDWKLLAKIREIEEVMKAAEAEVLDIS